MTNLDFDSNRYPARHFVTAAVIAGLLFAAAAGAQTNGETTSSAEALVDRYIAAFQGFDLETISTMWTEDVVYADPTYGSRTEGKEAVVEGLSGGMKGVTDVKLDVHTRFVSNGHAVVTYEGSATMTGTDATGGVDVPMRADGVIVLRLEGDRIAEHTDYVDYVAVNRQMAAAVSAASSSGAAATGGGDE